MSFEFIFRFCLFYGRKHSRYELFVVNWRRPNWASDLKRTITSSALIRSLKLRDRKLSILIWIWSLILVIFRLFLLLVLVCDLVDTLLSLSCFLLS